MKISGTSWIVNNRIQNVEYEINMKIFETPQITNKKI
jgi:hypothetical protein